jgi:dehydrogenase/reductase SDR family protein 1
MDEVRQLFKRIEEEQGGRLDILVNNAFSAAPVNLSRKLQFLRTYKLHLNHRPIIKAIVENMGKKFWEYEPKLWDEVNEVGLRNVYFCSTYAARLMVPRGMLVKLIVSWGPII